MILRYIGRKIRALPSLWAERPFVVGAYREAFCGSASSLRFIPPEIPCWINDRSRDVARFHTWVQRGRGAVDKLARIEQWIAAASADEVMDRHWREKIRWWRRGNPDAFYFLHRMSVGPMVARHRPNIASPCLRQFSSFRPRQKELFIQARERMRGVRVTCADYSVVLDAPGDDVFIYLDPPYCGAKEIYPHTMTDSEHMELRERLLACPHRWMLVVGDAPETREIYAGLQVLGSIDSGRRSFYRGGCAPQELIFTNY